MPTPDEQNPRFIATPGYNLDYGSDELRLAFAIADTASAIGGGTPSPVISVGINDSIRIQAIESSLAALENGLLNAPIGSSFNSFGAVGTSNIEIRPNNSTRTFFFFQNIGTIENIWVRFGGVASPVNSYVVFPGGTLTLDVSQIVNQSINIISINSGSNYVFHVIE